MFPVHPCPPTTGRGEGERGRETYTWTVKTDLLMTLVILIVREINYTRLIPSIPEKGAAAAKQHQEVPDWTPQ